MNGIKYVCKQFLYTSWFTASQDWENQGFDIPEGEIAIHTLLLTHTLLGTCTLHDQVSSGCYLSKNGKSFPGKVVCERVFFN
jgi:hypothetical protein